MLTDKEFDDITNDIMNHKEFNLLKNFQHHNCDVFSHSVKVSYISYKIAKRLGLDFISAARGGLLHDFFLYDWKEKGKLEKKSFFQKHGFTHSKEALVNAKRCFILNKKEMDIIRKHMFPLTISPPLTAESWIITTVDKYVAIMEYWEIFTNLFNNKQNR